MNVLQLKDYSDKLELLNEESSFPAQEESKTTPMMREAAIDLTMKQVITESIEDSHSAHTTDRVTSTLDLDENASNKSHVMRSHKVRCKPHARTRVIGSRKPRLTSRPGSSKQTRRRATRANSSGDFTTSKSMTLRKRPIQRRYVYDSPVGSPSATELSTSMIPCTSIGINSTSTISAPLMPQTVYEKSNPETNINTNLAGRNSFSINHLRHNLEYRTLMANQYSTPYAMNPTARHQMCYTCCIRLKNPLEFVKHIQQVHLGLSVPEMKMPKSDLTETNWSTYKNNSNNTVSSSVESQPQFDHVKSEI
ncbi:hypothetical protein FBUS_07512 [Fasciolopsis buskii]|uniref:Uncharacterized protein n=1 Tax=Fasciolopsis buskii TaxID=27845 RepID=A0A8E0RX30_9TREM|nr:hypothetical protein FBUS_07512 [Fasciolopsis buski]